MPLKSDNKVVSLKAMSSYLIARNVNVKLPDCLTETESFSYLKIKEGVTTEEAIAQARLAGIQVFGTEERDGRNMTAKRIEGDRD